MADRTPTKNRPPVSTTGWRSVEAHHVGSADQSTITDLEVLAQMAPALARSAPAVLAMMRGHQAGQPKAAHYGTSTDQADGADDRLLRLWCSLHDRMVGECVEAGAASCYDFGEVLAGPKDSVGEAAIVADPAAKDRAGFTKAIARARQALDDALAIASGYPAVPMEPADPASGPGEDLCRSHWKANKYAKIIETDGEGRPYYSCLCRWCGSTRRALGGNYFDRSDPQGDPPTFLVEAHILGSVPQALVEKAERQMAGKIKRAKDKAAERTSSRKRKRK